MHDWYIMFSWSVRIHPTTKDRGLSPAIFVDTRYTSQKCSQCGIIVLRHWQKESIFARTVG